MAPPEWFEPFIQDTTEMAHCRSRLGNDKLKPPNPREMYSDAAKRCADIVNGFIHSKTWDELRDSWVAIRLSDGGSDGVLYDNKRDAVSHQLMEQQCAYVSFRNLAQGISPIEAQRFLDFTRSAYDAGMRLPDPDNINGGPDLFMPTETYDAFRMSHARRQLYTTLAKYTQN